MRTMSIGQLASRSGIGVETVRYYERRGLLRPAERRTNGYRIYGPSELERLKLIRGAKSLAFTLREIRQLVERIDQRSCSCSQLQTATDAKLDEIDRHIARLKKTRRQLRALRKRCVTPDSTQCPVLSEL